MGKTSDLCEHGKRDVKSAEREREATQPPYLGERVAPEGCLFDGVSLGDHLALGGDDARAQRGVRLCRVHRQQVGDVAQHRGVLDSRRVLLGRDKLHVALRHTRTG